MQRTLNRELKELEVVGREAIVISNECPPWIRVSNRETLDGIRGGGRKGLPLMSHSHILTIKGGQAGIS